MGGSSSKPSAATDPAVPVVRRFPSASELSTALAHTVLSLYKKAVEKHGVFVVAVAGGSLPALLGPGLVSLKDEFDWAKWLILMVDERYVPNDHPDSNHRGLTEALAKHVPIDASNVVAIEHSSERTVAQAAEAYAKVFQTRGRGRLDLALMGIGPDGHCASLFPGHALLDVKESTVVPISDSPKPPSERITFTLPVLNDAESVIFVATGESKADVVARAAKPLEALDQTDLLPCARVRPANRAASGDDAPLTWFLDEPAASKL